MKEFQNSENGGKEIETQVKYYNTIFALGVEDVANLLASKLGCYLNWLDNFFGNLESVKPAGSENTD